MEFYICAILLFFVCYGFWKYEQMKDMMKQMEQYKKSGRMPPGMPPGFGGMR